MQANANVYCSLMRNTFLSGRFLNFAFSFRAFHAGEEGKDALIS